MESDLEKVLQGTFIYCRHVECAQPAYKRVPYTHGAASEKGKDPQHRTQLKGIQLRYICLDAISICPLE